MPDDDGISTPFPRGGVFCHGCDCWVERGETDEHRRSCGVEWRKAHAPRARVKRDPVEQMTLGNDDD